MKKWASLIPSKHNVTQYLLALALACVLLCTSRASYADFDQGFYLGAGFGTADIGVDNFAGTKIAMKLGEIFGGYKYRNWLGLEARYGASLVDETYALEMLDVNGRPDLADIEISSYYSLYYRAELTNDIAKIYILVGNTNIETETQFTEGLFVAEASGASYGIGGGLYLNPKMFFNIEYRTLIETGTDTFNVLSFNVDYRF